MAYELWLLWHTNPDFYAIWAVFIGVGGVVFNRLIWEHLLFHNSPNHMDARKQSQGNVLDRQIVNGTEFSDQKPSNMELRARIGGSQKRSFQKGGFGRSSPAPILPHVYSPAVLPWKKKAMISDIPGPQNTGTRAHSPKPFSARSCRSSSVISNFFFRREVLREIGRGLFRPTEKDSNIWMSGKISEHFCIRTFVAQTKLFVPNFAARRATLLQNHPFTKPLEPKVEAPKNSMQEPQPNGAPCTVSISRTKSATHHLAIEFRTFESQCLFV